MTLSDKEVDAISLSQKSKYTKDQFMNRCPHVMPECDQELNWFEEYLEKHPDEKANLEIAMHEFAVHQAAKYSWFRIAMRLFLEDHCIRGIGDFYLHVEDHRYVTIRPVCPSGKTLQIRL